MAKNDKINEVKKLRLEKHLSVRKLAEMANLSTGVIMRLEHGEAMPNEINLFKLAGALEVEPEEFVEMAKRVLSKETDTVTTNES